LPEPNSLTMDTHAEPPIWGRKVCLLSGAFRALAGRLLSSTRPLQQFEQPVPLRSHHLRWIAIAGTRVRSFDRTRASLCRLTAEPIYVFWHRPSNKILSRPKAPSQVRFLVAVQKKIAPCFTILGHLGPQKAKSGAIVFCICFPFLNLQGRM
jgi:hypothetical protein